MKPVHLTKCAAGHTVMLSTHSRQKKKMVKFFPWSLTNDIADNIYTYKTGSKRKVTYFSRNISNHCNNMISKR